MDKSKLKKVGLLVIIIGSVSASATGLGFYFWYNPIFNEQREPEKFFWVRWSGDAATVLDENYDMIDMISPSWYVLESDGNVSYGDDWESSTLSEHEQVLTVCASRGVEVHPMVAGGSQENMHNLLSDSQRQQNFIGNLTAIMVDKGFDGINIDFEGIDASYRAAFTAFYGDLKDAMPEDTNLSIAVPAKTWGSKTGWSGWCDYQSLGQISDMFMIMTYDEHGGWTDAGPVSSESWVKSVLAFAVREVPLEKLFIGIPRYGYDWSEDPDWENWGYGYQFFMDKKNLYGGTTRRYKDGYEVIMEYTDSEGYDHICYYWDAETTARREEFLSSYPIGGYCYWYLTSGDPAYFPA